MRLRRTMLSICILAVAGLPGGTPAEAGCPPLSGGADVFPSTLTMVFDDTGFGQPFVVRLSSAGMTDAIVQRAPQIGSTLDTELVQLELSGFHPRLGPLTLRESPTQTSPGQIREVDLDESCQLERGEASFDVFLEIEAMGQGETWIHTVPIRIESRLSGLPPASATYEVPRVVPVAVEDSVTHEPRGEILYLAHHVAPPFPPAGDDCFDALWTSDLELFGPATTVSLIGFGPMRVRRGPLVPGGTCALGGAPCDDDIDCALGSCLRSSVETEILVMDLAGSDALLGDWQISALPDIGTSNCCEAHAGGGCNDPVCEELICGLDPFCCSGDWDGLCAGLAQGEPICADNCLDPDAAPSLGTVRSVELDRSYPATSLFDAYLRMDTDNQGSFGNSLAMRLEPADPITNLPADPGTEHRYLGTPRTVVDEDDNPVGEISNVVLTSQPPVDCSPPPGADDVCLDGELRLELTLPGCAAETLSLPGGQRLLRDDPRDGAGLGQDEIQTVLARADYAGSGGCSGAVSVRLSAAASSDGLISSLAPEEFFPADEFHDLQLEIETASGLFTADVLRVSTSVNSVPPGAGEIYRGPDGVVDIRNGSGVKVGEILGAELEVSGTLPCPTGWDASIVFTGPTKDLFDVSIPGGGGGVEYDVVRGSLNALRASDGSFASATCLVSDAPPSISDSDPPPANDAHYYLARDGLGSFNGTWNGPGSLQQADRDALVPFCP